MWFCGLKNYFFVVKLSFCQRGEEKYIFFILTEGQLGTVSARKRSIYIFFFFFNFIDLKFMTCFLGLKFLEILHFNRRWSDLKFICCI